MECLNNYSINYLQLSEMAIYTKKLVEAFRVEDYYRMYLDDNNFNYMRGYKFLTAKLVKENEIIGGICLEGKPRYRNEIFIEQLFVDEKYRGEGVATSLLEYIIQNKCDIFKTNKINLYLFCEEYLREFYVKNKFYETDSFINSSLEKVLRMDRKI